MMGGIQEKRPRDEKPYIFMYKLCPDLWTVPEEGTKPSCAGIQPRWVQGI